MWGREGRGQGLEYWGGGGAKGGGKLIAGWKPIKPPPPPSQIIITVLILKPDNIAKLSIPSNKIYIYYHFTPLLGTLIIYFSLFNIEPEETVAGLLGWGVGQRVCCPLPPPPPPPPPSKIIGRACPPPCPLLFLRLWKGLYQSILKKKQ